MTFFYVVYGDNQRQIFNSKCKSVILLDKIKEVCNYVECNVIDLANQKGQCLFLHSKPNDYASDYLEKRGSYILCEVTKDENGNHIFSNLLQDSPIQIQYTPTPAKKKK